MTLKTPSQRPPRQPALSAAAARSQRRGRMRLAAAVTTLALIGFGIAALASTGTGTRHATAGGGASSTTAAAAASTTLAAASTPSRATTTTTTPTHAATTTAATATTTSGAATTSAAKPVPPPVVVDRPPRVRLVLFPALPGDGHWRRPERWTGWPAPVLTTTIRLDTADSSQVAYVAWFRAARTQIALYPGAKNPEQTSLPRGPEQVPEHARGRLVSVFNAGFFEKDAPAGFFVNGLLYHPMIAGLGTVLQYRNGRVDVTTWRGGDTPGTDVVMARQNLVLFVDHHRVNPALDVSERWGSTWHGAPAVWRSGLGVDAHGNLMYLAAPNQTAPSLADLLVRAGAVRAMQLDINPAWPVLVTYGGRFAQAADLFVQNPNQSSGRFLSPDNKDFFAMYLRGPGPVANEPY